MEITADHTRQRGCPPLLAFYILCDDARPPVGPGGKPRSAHMMLGVVLVKGEA